MQNSENIGFENIVDCIPVAVLIYKMQKGRVSVIYTNAYFRSLPLASDIEIMSLHENELLQLVHPDDRKSAKDFFADLFQKMVPGEMSYRSLLGKSTEYRWYHLSASPIAQSDGSALAYVVFTDITLEKETEIRALKNQQMYQLLAEYSKQIVFEYDQRHRRVIYQMDNAYTRAICEAQGMPPVVDNVPDSLVEMVDEPYREQFIALFHQGNPDMVRPAFEYSTVIQGKTHWWRVSSTPVTDSAGNVLTIYCCAQDITDMKLERQRYLDFFHSLDKAYPNNLGSFHLNLTRNICIDGKSPLAFVMKQKESGTVDGYFEEFSKLLAQEETITWFRREFTREALLDRFRNGETTMAFTYSIRYADGLRWRQAILIMHQNPRTEDVEAVTYALDIDQQKRGEMILQHMASEGSDLVGYIDVLSETFMVYNGIWKGRGLKNGQRMPYGQYLARLKTQGSSSADPVSFGEQVSLERIQAKLRDSREYSVLYDLCEADGQILKKQLVFQWLSDKKDEILVIQSDVTRVWHEEQERLRRNEEAKVLKNIVSRVPIGIIVIGVQENGKHLIAENARIHELLHEGYQSEERFFQYVHADDRKKCQAVFEQCESSARPVTIEFRFLHEQKTAYKWLRMLAMGGRQQDGQQVVYCCFSDVTAEKAAEKTRREEQARELHKYEAQLRTMAATNADFAACYHLNITKDRCTNMVVQSEAYAALKQLSMAGTADGLFEAVADTVPDQLIAAQIRSVFHCVNLLQRFERGETKISIEYPCHSVRGGVRWILGSVNMVRNPVSGDVEGVTYAVDITDRKKTEFVTRRTSEQEFEYVGILYLGTGEIELVQKKAHVEYPEIGVRVSYAARRHFVQENFISAQERESYNQATDMERIRDQLAVKGTYTFSYLQTDSAGKRACQQMRFSWLDREQQMALIVQTDVTASYEHEEKQIVAIQNALIEAEQASSAKSDFVSRISHDIRTPIGAISNLTDFALEDIHNPEKLKDDLRKIQVSNNFLLSLVNDVLDISKIDSGKIELHPEALSYADFRSSVLNMFEPICESRHIRFALGAEPAVPILRIDKVRFNQIAMNLISNAVKYTPDGGTVTVQVETARRPDGQCDCTLTVSDTGIGMSKAFQKTMFEPFTQEENNPHRDKTTLGSGLGLSLVKKIVDLMCGTIAVKSELGQGTEIKVSFTAGEANKAASMNSLVHMDTMVKKTLSGRILLAEDNEINKEIAQRILETFGLDVVHAENGKRAVEQFAEELPGSYDVILMDIQMPVMNGYDASKAIRAMNRPDARKIPIIAMTADAFSAAIEHSRYVGMTDYLTKPLDIKLLWEVLVKYI